MIYLAFNKETDEFIDAFILVSEEEKNKFLEDNPEYYLEEEVDDIPFEDDEDDDVEYVPEEWS